MANRLTMATVPAILALHRLGHSNRKIARLLGIHRETVAEHLRAAESQNRPNTPTGSDDESSVPGEVCRAIIPGPPSQCERFRETIAAKVEAGLSAVRIFQDLVEEGFEGKYWSVRRYVTRLTAPHDLPFRRMETMPGEEAQVDFGTGAAVRMADGKLRRPWIFRIVLSYSRKAYSEAVWRQTSEAFMQCLENAFRHFGGVPKRLVTGQLEGRRGAGRLVRPGDPSQAAIVRRALRHGFLPTKPYTPRHKGKIESGVKYVKRMP